MTDRNEKRRLDSGAPGIGHQQTGVSVAAGDDRLLTAAEVAQLLSVDVSWVRSASRSGAIPCVPLPGRFVRFRRQAILDWVEALEQPGRVVKLRSAEPRRPA